MHTNESPVQNVLDYLASFEMFKQPTHVGSVDWTPNNHGYPFVGTCTCGFTTNRYAARHAAETMLNEHLKGK